MVSFKKKWLPRKVHCGADNWQGGKNLPKFRFTYYACRRRASKYPYIVGTRTLFLNGVGIYISGVFFPRCPSSLSLRTILLLSLLLKYLQDQPIVRGRQWRWSVRGGWRRSWDSGGQAQYLHLIVQRLWRVRGTREENVRGILERLQRIQLTKFKQ